MTVVDHARALSPSHRDKRVASDAERVSIVQDGSAVVRGEPVCSLYMSMDVSGGMAEMRCRSTPEGCHIRCVVCIPITELRQRSGASVFLVDGGCPQNAGALPQYSVCAARNIG